MISLLIMHFFTLCNLTVLTPVTPFTGILFTTPNLAKVLTNFTHSYLFFIILTESIRAPLRSTGCTTIICDR